MRIHYVEYATKVRLGISSLIKKFKKSKKRHARQQQSRRLMMIDRLEDRRMLAANGDLVMQRPEFHGIVEEVAVEQGRATPGFDIVLNNICGPLSGAETAAFAAAEATWESIITGYSDTVASNTLTIDSCIGPIDGPGGILGFAGPTFAKGGTTNFLYTNEGDMTFDSADTPGLGGALADVILHEMGHVLGIGTLWSSSDVGFPGFQELYVNGSGAYTGAAGLAAYNAEFSQAGASVPVELGGGGGTANGHWNEVDGGAGSTGIVSNVTGQDMRFELMTGWLNAPTFISTLTSQSMMDLGYEVDGGGDPVKDPGCAYVDANNDIMFHAADGDVKLRGSEVTDGVFSTKKTEGAYTTERPGAGLVLPASLGGVFASEIRLEAEGQIVVDTNVTGFNNVKFTSFNDSVIFDDPTISSLVKDVKIVAKNNIVAHDDRFIGRKIDLNAKKGDIRVGGSEFDATQQAKFKAGGDIDAASGGSGPTTIEATDPKKGTVNMNAKGDVNCGACDVKAGKLFKVKAGGNFYGDGAATFVAFGSNGRVDIQTTGFIDFFDTPGGGSKVQAVKRINMRSKTSYVDLTSTTVAICDPGGGNTTGDIKRISGTTILVGGATILSPDELVLDGTVSGAPASPIFPGNGTLPCDC